MNQKQLKAISDPTRLTILSLLAATPLTNTELYEKLDVAYRESVFKSLKHLKQAGLIKREYKEKKGYVYSLNFKKLEVGNLKISF